MRRKPDFRSEVADLDCQPTEVELAGLSGPQEDIPGDPGSIDMGASGTADEALGGLFQLAFDSSPVGSAILNSEGRWLRFNQALCDFFGMDRTGLSVTSVFDLVDPTDRDTLITDLAASFPRFRRVERRFRDHQERTIWARLSISVTTGGGATPSVRICQFEDVTERYPKASADAFDHCTLIEMITNAPHPMALFDTSMHYLTHSAPWLTLIGKEGETIIGRSHYEVLPTIPERWKEAHRLSLAGAVLKSNEDRWDDASGSVRHLRWALCPWRTAGGQIGGIVMMGDRIDDLVQARQAAHETSQLKSAFLANMSHEIRTPMNAILRTVDLLLDTPLSTEQTDLAASILDCGHAILTLIDDILDFSRMGSGKLVLRSREFNLATVLAETADIMVLAAQAKGIELLTDYPADLPDTNEGDSGRIRQILLNLVGNAIKFTEAGEVRISVRALPHDQQWDLDNQLIWLRLAVTDTGIGIPAARQRTIFHSLTQGDGSVSPSHGGTELGLSICQRLAHLLGGSIRLTSEPGLGSTFELELPLTRRFAAQPIRAEGRLLVGRTVLVADGSASARSLIRSRLETWGSEVIEVGTAADAVDVLKSIVSPERSPVLLIAERLVEVAPRFLHDMAEDADLAGVPMIFMTSGSSRIRGANHGSCLTVAQPIRWVCLLKALTGAVHQSTRASSSTLVAIEEGSVAPPKLAGVRVLLAEDNPTNQKIAGKMLKRLGCLFEVVADGVEALALLDHAEFDLILMDVQMPRMDGYQATGEIRRREKARRDSPHLPIIAMTAHAMQGDRERCLAAQMDDYLSKPVTTAKLAEMIERWVGPHNPESTTEPSRPTPTAPVLQIARLQELSLGDVEFEQELLECLLTDISNGMDRLRAALEPLDPVQVATTLHGIVGACRTVGAEDLGAWCRDCEHQANEPSFRPDTAWLATIERKRDDLIAAVTTHLRH